MINQARTFSHIFYSKERFPTAVSIRFEIWGSLIRVKGIQVFPGKFPKISIIVIIMTIMLTIIIIIIMYSDWPLIYGAEQFLAMDFLKGVLSIR